MVRRVLAWCVAAFAVALIGTPGSAHAEAEGSDLALGDIHYVIMSQYLTQLWITVLNHGPGPETGVKVYIDGIHPKVVPDANCTWSGGQVVCVATAVSVMGQSVPAFPRCVDRAPVTVTVTPTTPDMNPADNTRLVPALEDPGPSCEELFNPPRPQPPVPTSGGSETEPGAGGGSGIATAMTTTDTSSPTAIVEPTASLTANTIPTASESPAPSRTVVAADIPTGGGVGHAVLVATAAVVLIAGAAGGWWWRRRRSTRDIRGAAHAATLAE